MKRNASPRRLWPRKRKDGPRSPALIQLLTELGVLYETEGQHVLATAVLEQARQLVRANYGLHTLDQVPLMQQALANQQAIGNFPMVRALEEELLDLAERNPDDLRAAAIHRDAGKRRLDVLRRFLAGEAPERDLPGSGDLFVLERRRDQGARLGRADPLRGRRRGDSAQRALFERRAS